MREKWFLEEGIDSQFVRDNIIRQKRPFLCVVCFDNHPTLSHLEITQQTIMRGPKGSKRRGAQETHQTDSDQDPSFSPLSGSRYPKRSSRGVAYSQLYQGIMSHNPDESCSRYPKKSSRGVVPQLSCPSSGNHAEINNHNPSHSRSLQRPLRFLNEARVIPKPELQNFSSQPADDPVCGISEDNVKSSPLTGSPSCSAPLNQQQLDLDALCSKIVSQVEGTDEVTPQPLDLNGDSQQQINLGGFDDKLVSQVEGTEEVAPQLQDVNGDSQLPREDVRSLNSTEFARVLHNDSDVDPDEVESAPGPCYGIVHGHRVKIEFAPLLTEIFQRYGNITMETNVPSFVLERLLEHLCTVYQGLEHRKLFDLTRLEINEMLRDLDFIVSQKINAGWLLAKVNEISEAKSSLKTYTKLKDEANKCVQFNEKLDKELELQRRHIILIQKKVSETEEVKAANEDKVNEWTKMALDIKTRVKALANKPLVHGLL